MLTNESPPDEVAAAIIAETKRRGYSRDESIACVSTGLQESGLRMVWDSGKRWFGIFQQDSSYPNRFDPMGNILGFLDRLDQKRRSPGASPDPFKNIFWLQQRPSENSADEAFNDPKARRAYYDEIRRHIGKAADLYDRHSGQPTPPPPLPPATYGMPRGSNSGGYGGSGVQFPSWVYALGNAFGLKPSTYPGHQESDRNEAGYAPNPQRLNRGIDWAAPGAPDEVDRMQRLADYLATIPQHLEQVIWQNPKTMRSVEVAGGRHQPGYFRDDLAGHRNHVHTRQSKPIPPPGGVPAAPKAAPPARPQFQEHAMFGTGGSKRSRPPINFFIHTEEGNGTAKSLAEYCQGQNGVSYHYTLRDRIVYDVVDTDLYSWSVLDANVFSINLCFAGSRAAFTREQWLQREPDIEIAAYIAVQDARKYGFSTEVVPPPYSGAARAGISDHKYVTQKLRIGDHTDVGNNFPWDVFARYVNKYANTAAPSGDDELSAEAERLIREMRAEIRELRTEWGPDKRSPSRSFMAEDGQPVDSPLGFLYNIDGNGWTVVLTLAYLFHVPKAIEVVETIARGGVYKGTWAQKEGFNAWLRDFGQAYCQGLVEFKAALVAKLSPKASVAVPGVPVSVDARDIADQLAMILPTPDTAALEQAYTEIARLREENTRLQAGHGTVAVPDTGVTLGQKVGQFVDAVDKLGLADSSDIQERATLAASIKVLSTKNGTEI